MAVHRRLRFTESMWSTHEIENQVESLSDYNPFATDAALREGLTRAGAGWAEAQLNSYGATLGSAETLALATQANRHTPELRTHDARGRRIDTVDFHPSWHALLAHYRGQGLVSLPYDSERPGRWTAFAAGFYLHGQIEAGTLCPATMTQAAIPVLAREPLFEQVPKLRAGLLSRAHDPRDLPAAQKTALWIGMGMTEKQGGSDVRANTTRATPLDGGGGGRGAAYTLRGHKWFFSAPMSDAHLVVAQTEHGPGCFYVPRWLPDGTRNAIEIQRLKDKLGNRSNSSAEVEFRDAWGLLIGEPGRGIPTIIEMATTTRLNCVIGSAAIQRQALVQALHHTRHRRAFGARLVEQPLMRSVLADLALESEASCALMLRLAAAFEAEEKPWQRLMTPAAKFWVCKRAVELTGEAMEVWGGNGYVEDGPLARLYREAPVNSIWEGSGNVMCLDLLRGIAREPAAAFALLDELQALAGDEPRLRRAIDSLRDLLQHTPPAELEGLGRRLAQRLVLTAQACLLRARAPDLVAEAFIASRFDAAGDAGRVYGALDTRGIDVQALLERAWPD
jgi:putative acyl-CoA dehydrogenase